MEQTDRRKGFTVEKEHIVPAAMGAGGASAGLVAVFLAVSQFIGTPEQTEKALLARLSQMEAKQTRDTAELRQAVTHQVNALREEVKDLQRSQESFNEKLPALEVRMREMIVTRTSDRWSRANTELLYSHLRRLMVDKNGKELPPLSELVHKDD